MRMHKLTIKILKIGSPGRSALACHGVHVVHHPFYLCGIFRMLGHIPSGGCPSPLCHCPSAYVHRKDSFTFGNSSFENLVPEPSSFYFTPIFVALNLKHEVQTEVIECFHDGPGRNILWGLAPRDYNTGQRCFRGRNPR